LKNNFHTKGRGAPKNAGPLVIAIFATIVNPALDIAVHVCDCIHSGVQVSLSE